MVLTIAAGAVVIFVLLGLLAERLVKLLPFETERALAPFSAAEALPAPQEQLRHYLQQLTERLAAAGRLPPEWVVTVHYRDEPVVNAYAAPGGHIFLYRGLLEQLPSENALALLLSHELAHVHHRDPLVALGRGVALGVVLASVMASGNDWIAHHLLGDIGTLTAFQFSRSQETAAAAAALAAVFRYYGHVNGAGQLFEVLQRKVSSGHTPLLFRTHPMTSARSAAVADFARGHPDRREPTPLPAWWLKALAAEPIEQSSPPRDP